MPVTGANRNYSEHRKLTAGTGAPTGVTGTRGSGKNNGMGGYDAKSAKGAPMDDKKGTVDHGAIRERTHPWRMP